MMKQPSLFDDARSGTALSRLGVPGSQSTLSKAQKLFNRLIGKIGAQRDLLRQWRDFEPIYQQRVNGEIVPLHERLRERRIAMVALLDQAMENKALGKTHRAKVRDILLGQLAELIGEAPDPELVRLYDKHSDVSYADEQQDDMDFAQAVASDLFGVELDAEDRATSPEELAQRIAEKVQAAQAERAQQAAARQKKRKKTPKAAAQEAVREQVAQGASRAIREVFRKLASELHPDREPDLEERTRKTALMQQVNVAYAAGDLLALLELQLSIEQIDAAALASLAQDRLAHYNRVLEEQLQRLQEELSEITAPFVMSMGGPVRGAITPAVVQQALDRDVRELQTMVESLETDLVNFRDIKVLKSSLRHYRVDQGDADDLDMLDSLLLAELQARGSPR